MNTNGNKRTRFFCALLVVAGATILFAVDNHFLSTRYLNVYRNLREDNTVEIKRDEIGCISKNNKLVYVHIPKTGGSTIEESELFADAYLPGGHRKIWQLMHNSEERGIADFETSTTVRHPCDRFVSAFRFSTSEISNDNVKKLAKELIGEKTIDEYVEYLEENDWNPLGPFFLFWPQYLFIMDRHRESVEVDTILCQEQWNEGIERLQNKLRISNVLPTLNRHKKLNKHEACADLKPETRVAIERYYEMDYCLFGYESLPGGNEKMECIGKENNKETMTIRYHECKERLKTSLAFS